MNAALARERFALWLELVVYEVRKSHVGTALGFVWAVLEPLLLLGTYFFLFVIVLGVDRGERRPVDVLVTMFAGLVPWLYFANTISRGMTLLPAHANLVKQINFPVGLLPFVVVAQVSVELLISLVLLLGIAWVAGSPAPANLLLIPAVVLFMSFLIPMAAVASCYTVMLPDLQRLLPAALRVGIYITPVLYVPAAMMDNVRWVAYVNPISYFISPFRYAVLQDPKVLLLGLWPDFGVAAAVTVVTALVAFLHRNYVRNVVVDYL